MLRPMGRMPPALLALALAVLAESGEVQVQLSAKNKGECGKDFETHFWIPRAVLPALGMPAKTCASTHACGSIVIDSATYNLDQINVADGHDVCGACNCDLAYLNIAKGEQLSGLRCGVYATISYSDKPRPYHPPVPPPSPTPSPGPPSPPTPPPPPPLPPSPSFDVGGIHLQLENGVYTAQLLNKSVHGQWGKANNFSFVGPANNRARAGCYLLGDLTIRLQPSSGSSTARGAGGTEWAVFDSAMAAESSWRGVTDAGTGDPNVLAAHDITALLNSSQLHGNGGYNNSYFGGKIPLRVVRAWEKAPGGKGIVMRFNITNTGEQSLRLGGLGFAMPQAGMMHGIEESVWLDPHVGGDHGFVEWVRVVVDEQTLLATSEGTNAGMEAWRPLMEGCARDHWEWTVHSEAWASEWAENKQFPFLQMEERLAQARSKIDNTTMWPTPHRSPWPSWHGRETVPVTDFQGMSAPWNIPSSGTLAAGETSSYAIRLTMAEKGPRTRNDALHLAGRAVLRAVPGYVIAPDMTSAKLFVTCPAGVTLDSLKVSAPGVLNATMAEAVADRGGQVAIDIAAVARGRARLTLRFSDGSEGHAHYAVLPPLATQIERVGVHWAEDAWLPLESADPFGRGASVMPYDRHDRARVLDDSRAYDVGLSDDAGGGNPLGFAIKVAYAPNQFQVTRLDDYVKYTLYGVKTPVTCPGCHALPPYKSLQIRPEDCDPALGTNNGSECGNEDGIRMTMYYYGTDFNNSAGGWSGHWPYNYSEADKIGMRGIEGGPNWAMTEHMANATYRAFNFPHHVTTYLALYYAARHTELTTYQAWDWYLMRAANTTLKFGAPSVGVMDDTVFREILRAVSEESAADPARADFANAARDITANMYQRASGRFSEAYPYGSEFAFDTTGQEAVVVWLLYFANATNTMAAAAKETVDHVLSYMRSSATWAYNGGSRSWGDLGNNGKWQVTSGTNFETRGNFHYRSGLNAIPLLEWYRANPDDFLLLEVALGAVAGQMSNIDERGAPSMMMHMEPHILDFDPHSGDFGLGFFGCSTQSASYYVEHQEMGPLCFLCNLDDQASGMVTIKPVDLYRRRVYLEPLALYLTLDVGTFASVTMDKAARKLTLEFNSMAQDNSSFVARRLRVEKLSATRPGAGFAAAFPKARGAYVIPEATATVELTWA